jgi:hypothetical protein
MKAAKVGAKALDVTGASWVETPAIWPHASGCCNANKKLRNVSHSWSTG